MRTAAQGSIVSSGNNSGCVLSVDTVTEETSLKIQALITDFQLCTLRLSCTEVTLKGVYDIVPSFTSPLSLLYIRCDKLESTPICDKLESTPICDKPTITNRICKFHLMCRNTSTYASLPGLHCILNPDTLTELVLTGVPYTQDLNQNLSNFKKLMTLKVDYIYNETEQGCDKKKQLTDICTGMDAIRYVTLFWCNVKLYTNMFNFSGVSGNTINLTLPALRVEQQLTSDIFSLKQKTRLTIYFPHTSPRIEVKDDDHGLINRLVVISHGSTGWVGKKPQSKGNTPPRETKPHLPRAQSSPFV